MWPWLACNLLYGLDRPQTFGELPAWPPKGMCPLASPRTSWITVKLFYQSPGANTKYGLPNSDQAPDTAPPSS